MSFSTGAQHSGMQMFMFPPLAGVLRVRAYMHACVRTCMRACVRVCVCVRACACVSPLTHDHWFLCVSMLVCVSGI